MKIIKLKIEDVVYFLTEQAHEHLVELPCPYEMEVLRLSHVAIDTVSMRILKCRMRIEDVIISGLENL